MTFQPLLCTSVPRRCRSAGVTVATAQLGAFSPVEVQNVVSTKLPPKRTTPGPRVFMYWSSVPADSGVPASTFFSNDRPMKSSRRAAPLPGCMVTVTDVAADAGSVVATIPAAAARVTALNNPRRRYLVTVTPRRVGGTRRYRRREQAVNDVYLSIHPMCGALNDSFARFNARSAYRYPMKGGDDAGRSAPADVDALA